MNTLKKLRFAREGYLVLSTAICLAGLMYPCVTALPPLLVHLAAGFLLILYGLIRIVGYYSDDLYCLAFQYGLACGLLLVVLGVIVLILYPRIRDYLLPGLGLLILIDGLLTVQTAGEARRFGLSTWGLLLAAGAAAGVLGAMLLDLKPLLLIHGERLDACAKVRGTKNCRQRLLQEMQRCAARMKARGLTQLQIGAAGSFVTPEEHQEWEQMVRDTFPG